MRRSAVLAAALVVLVGGAALFSFLGKTPKRPSVILYMIDTLRADHLSAYDYGRETTPQLDAFAREAVLFRKAYAQASWTKPSVASVFTALFPSRHGAVEKENRIREDVAVFTELLRDAGYTTAAFISNPNVLPPFGFGRGFDVVVDVGARTWAEGRPGARAAAVHDELFRYLDQQPERPLFLYVHVLDPHDPYDAPPGPFRKAFFDAQTPQGSRERIVALYDGEIAYVDDLFGDVVSRLEREGLRDDAIIAVLSDHGEEFWEHGGTGHGKTLYEEQLHVPLILRLPGGQAGGRQVEQPVRLLDLMPTIAELVGIPIPPGIDGTSFAPLLVPPADPRAYDPPLYAELSAYGHVISSLRDGDHKLIRRSMPAQDRGESLFHLGDDGGEQRNLAGEERERLETLARRLDAVESTLFGGIYVELRNGLAPDAVHRFEGCIEAGEVQFDEVAILDHRESFQVAPDRRRVCFDVGLRNEPTSIRQTPPVIMDVARVRLATSATTLRLDVRLDGVALGPDRVQLGGGSAASGSGPLELAPASAELRLSSPGLLSRPAAVDAQAPYAIVYSVPLPRQDSVEVDAELRERLRALGYLD